MNSRVVWISISVAVLAIVMAVFSWMNAVLGLPPTLLAALLVAVALGELGYRRFSGIQAIAPEVALRTLAAPPEVAGHANRLLARFGHFFDQTYPRWSRQLDVVRELSEDGINTTVTEFSGIADNVDKVLEVAQSTSCDLEGQDELLSSVNSDIRSGITRVVTALQFQDRMAQILGNQQSQMLMMQERIQDIPLDDAADHEQEVIDWLEEMSAMFTTREENAAHGNDVDGHSEHGQADYF